MPSRPDLRDLVTSVRDAFADADRETLLDVLTFVVQEYVVDGPPPMLMHQTEKLSDLASLSFAQLVSALQTRLEVPELSLFTVDGEQVSVRIGGVMQPLVMARAPVAAELPRPGAGVHVVETPTLPRPASAAMPSPASAPQTPTVAPRPVQGISLRGRPTAEGQPAGAPPAPVAQAPQSQAQSQGAATPNPTPADKPKDSGDDSSTRFSLLELD
jgi:hypothetical protein